MAVVLRRALQIASMVFVFQLLLYDFRPYEPHTSVLMIQSNVSNAKNATTAVWGTDLASLRLFNDMLVNILLKTHVSRCLIKRSENMVKSSKSSTTVKDQHILTLVKRLIIALLLQQCGDVAVLLNPGPRGLRPRCESCKKGITRIQGIMSCSFCSSSFHLKCIGIQYEISKCCTLTHDDLHGGEPDEDGVYAKINELEVLLKQRGLKFTHLNVCSVINKIEELRLLLKHHKGIHLLAGTESHLTSRTLDAEIEFHGYNLFRADRKGTGSTGGGILVYLDDSISAIRKSDLERDSVESIWIEVLLPKAKGVLIGTVYRPPVGSVYLESQFNTVFDEILSCVASENKEAIIMGI